MFNKKLLSSIDLGKYEKKNPYKKDMILDPMGQWKHPGKNTRIPSDRITMKGVNYPVLGVSNTGQKQMMQPGGEYNFPGADYVDEYPQMAAGGSSEQKIIFAPKEGGCPDGEYWTGTECKPIPKNTKIVYSQEELDKLNISKKEQQRLYNEYIGRINKKNAIDSALKKKYGPIQSKEKFYSTFESIPGHGFSPMMSYGPASLTPNGLGPGIPSMNETMVDFKTWKKMLDKSPVKPIGYKGHPGGGHFFPVYEKPGNYILGYNKEEKKLDIEPIKPPAVPLRVDNGILPPLQQSTYVPQEPIEAPQYTLDPYTADRLRLSVTPGKTRKVTKRGRLFDGKGQGYKHTEYKSTKDLEFGKKEVTRLIPRIVQKVTGYDPAYFEGSYDEEGNYTPGELDYGNEVGGRMEFRGAASLQDLINQQKYAKEWEEYERKIDEREEQSKKKQEQGQAFKKGGSKTKYTSDIINSTNYLFAEHPLFKKKKQSKKRIYSPNAKYYANGGENLQEECPPYYYWNGETCVPVSRELAPLDPQYLSENPDVATNMQIEPEVSVSPLGSDFSKAMSWIAKWHDSPMHDEMLMKSLQGNKKLFKEYKDKRKKNIQTIPALDIDFDKTNPDYKEISEEHGFSPWGSSNSNTGAVSVYDSYPGNKQMLIHEVTHSSDRPDDKLGRLIPPNDQLTMQYRTPLNWKNSQYGKDMMKEYKEKGWRLDDEYMGEEEIPRDIYEQQQFNDWNKYLLSGQGTEVRTRLSEIRQGAQEKNIYDPFNKKITRRQFKNLKNLKYPKPLNDLRKTFSDKDIRWMLNNISKNNNETEDAIQYSKKGGALPKGKYGYSVGNLIRKQFGGGLPKAQFGLTGMGKYPAVTATPFDFRTSYGQTSDFNKNPNYSLTYTVPRLFKKAELAGNPLSFTLGRPYNTDAESLTNRSLNFIPQEGLFSSYYDPATQGASNPQYQQYLQDVSDTTGTPVSELNQTVINQYNAAKNLAGAKPLYKKGIPLTANIGWDAYGTAFGDRSSGPFTGYGSLNAGYAPEPGFYGTADLGIMGVFGKRKNNASIKPQTYFNKGLTKQGDRAFIPKLNILNFAVRQRPEYNDIQTQQLLDLYQKDIEQGTKTAEQFLRDKTDEKRFDLSFISPEGTVQIKPFKNIPGVFSATAGLKFDYGGKDTSGDRIPITPKPYGNVRYTVPLDIELPKNKIAHLFDKGVVDRDGHVRIPKKTYSDYAYNQDYDEEYTDEYTGDTPEEETPTENNFEVNPPELQINPNGTVIRRGDCPEGYERPCEKCRCQKIKIPQMYTDKRGTHLFGNEPIRFKDGGERKKRKTRWKNVTDESFPQTTRTPIDSEYLEEYPDFQPYMLNMPEVALRPRKQPTFLRRTEDTVNEWLGNPMDRAAREAAQRGGKEDPVDNFRHPMAGYYTAQKIGPLGANALGILHEISTLSDPRDTRPWYNKLRESAEDIYNNSEGATLSFLPESWAKSIIGFESDNNLLPDGVSNPRGKNMYFKEDGGDVELKLTQKEIDKYVKGGYIVEDISVPSLTRMDEGGEKRKKRKSKEKNVEVIDSTEQPITPENIEQVIEKPEVEVNPAQERVPLMMQFSNEFQENNPYDAYYEKAAYDYLKSKKGWNEALGINKSNLPENVAKRIQNNYYKDLQAYVVNKSKSTQKNYMGKFDKKGNWKPLMGKNNTLDLLSKRPTGHGSWDNYGDGSIQMVYPEQLFMGPGAGALGLVGRAAAKGISNLAKSSLVQGTKAALNVPIANIPGATIGNAIASGFAADALVNRLPEIPSQIAEGNYLGALENTATGALDLAGANMMSPLVKGARNLSRDFGKNIAKGYETLATGNSPLPIAWKLENPSPLESILQNKNYNLTDEEAEIINEYIKNPYIIKSSPEKSKMFTDIIRKNQVDLSNINQPISRYDNYYVSTYGRDPLPTEYGSTFSYPRERSWSIGIDNNANTRLSEKQRLVIPSRYAKKLNENFHAINYSDSRLTEALARPYEKELIGNVPEGFKVIGNVKEGNIENIIIKPKKIRSLKKEPKWEIPSNSQLKQEFKVEHELKGNTFFESEDQFMKAVKNATVEEITPELDASIGYRSRTASKDALVNMSKGYKSWPKFRNEGTIDAIYEGLSTGKKMDMPIVLEFPNGTRRIFSGNTRMDASFQLGKNPKVLVVKVPIESPSSPNIFDNISDVNKTELNVSNPATELPYDLEKNRNAAAIIEDLKYDRYLKINSPEGKRRIEELIANNPHMKNMTYEDVKQGFANMVNENAMQAAKEDEFVILNQKIKNLESSPNPDLAEIEKLKIQANNLEGEIVLKEMVMEEITHNARMRRDRPVAVSDLNTTKDSFDLNKDALPSDIWSVLGSPEFTVDDLSRIIPHEFGHYFQQGAKTNLDDMLSKISLKTNDSSLNSNLFSNEKGASNFFNKIMREGDPFQRMKKYWKQGGKGQEKTAFMEEVRADMLQRGMIEDLYQTITPELLKDHYLKYMAEVGNKYPLRIYEIMKNNSGNFKIMSNVLNKMPALVPIGAVGAGMMMQNNEENNIPKQKRGGIVLELPENKIKELIKQGYIIEEID